MPSAVIGALRVNLAIDTAQFREGLKDAQRSLGKVGKSMQNVGRNMSLAVSAPLAGLGAMIVKTAGDFEASMSRLNAATGATSGQFAAMEKLARDLGKSTIFSASEAAAAMETLAKNGLSVEQILGGAAQASLDLAAATGSEMAGAADVATDVMLSFGKQAGDLQEVVNGITGTLLESKFGFDDYRLAIGQAGGVAGGLGVEFEDFNAALVATANLFASGSDAGTSFKTFLQRLTPQSKNAAAAMEELGLEFFDAQGNMKSMEAIAEELRTGLSGLSEEARVAALTDIFGTDAMRTAIGLAGTTTERFREIQAALAEASGAEQAAARLGPFNAAMEQLSGAFEELQISIAKSGLLEFVTQLVTKITEWVNHLSEVNPALLKWGTVIGGLAIALGPVVLSLGLLATGVLALSAPVATVIAGFAALTAAVIAFWPEITNLATIITTFLAGAWAQFEAAWDTTVTKVHGFKDALIELGRAGLEAVSAMVTGITEWVGTKLNAVWDGVTSRVQAVTEKFKSMYQAVVGGSYVPDMVTEVGQWMAQLPDKMMAPAFKAAEGVEGAFAGVGDSISSMFSSFGSSVAEAIKGTKSWSDVLRDVLGQIARLALSGLGQMGGFGGFLSSILGGLLGFAGGGSFQVGGAGGIDSQLVAFKASPDETVSITKPGQDIGGGPVFAPVYHIDARGADAGAVARIEAGLRERDRKQFAMVNTANKKAQTRRIFR